MTEPVLEVDWFAECSRDGCDGTARWVSRNPAATGGVLIPAALAYIAQKMLGGSG